MVAVSLITLTYEISKFTNGNMLHMYRKVRAHLFSEKVFCFLLITKLYPCFQFVSYFQIFTLEVVKNNFYLLFFFLFPLQIFEYRKQVENKLIVL